MKKIVIISLNPALDISYQIKNFKINETFRAIPIKTPGGKGINVAKVLKILNIPFNITGFLGGATGIKIKKELDALNIKNSFFQITNETRNCISFLSNKTQTEILESGPYISTQEKKEFFKSLKNILNKADIISINGSLPNNIPENFYKKLCDEIKDKLVILDSSGLPLKLALSSNPFLIKPNKDELEQLLDRKLNNKEEIVKAGKQLQTMGAKNVLISLGNKGAIFIGKKIYNIVIPSINAINPVGSGDASIAGFIYGIYNNLQFEEILKFSMSCGMANALNLKTGDLNIDDVLYLKDKIIVNDL